jgi:hypothetical protein
VRIRAASWLCRLGDRGGLPVLLREGRELASLNAIRCPGSWQRLREKRLTEPLEGSLKEVLTKIAIEAGLPMEISEQASIGSRRALADHRRLTPKDCPTLLEALDRLTRQTGSETFILEEDRLRLVGDGDAWKFWEGWAAPSAAASPALPQRR